MFEDEYKNANENIKLSQESKNKILDNMQKMSRRKKHSGMLIPALCCCLSLCFVAAVVLGILKGQSDEKNGIALQGQFAKLEPYESVGSYDMLFAKLSEIKDKNSSTKGEIILDETVNGVPNAAPMPTDAPASTAVAEAVADGDFSTTNTQYKDVDEADVIKTNGKYIFALCIDRQSIKIYRANGEKTKRVSTVKANEAIKSLGRDINFCEMFLSGNTLVVIANIYSSSENGKFYFDDIYYGYEQSTAILFYDIENAQSPKLKDIIKQDGGYISSRITNGALYVISNDYNYAIKEINKDEPQSFVPCFEKEGEKCVVQPLDIYMMECESSPSYTYVTKTDMESFEVVSSIAVLGEGSNVFASSSSILLYQPKYESQQTSVIIENGKIVKTDDENSTVSLYESTTNTALAAISIAGETGDKMRVVASTMIEGSINDQFSIDEYNGYFRIVSTTNKYSYVMQEHKDEELGITWAESVNVEGIDGSVRENSLYILNDNLETVGSIKNIAQGELVKSARFMGDVGYFVTFRQTDPLFSVDLSSPSNPTIIGKLKIPGFSTYLQSFGSGLLFGFGSAADEDSGGVYGLKMSMFDISNPKDVTEVACKELYGEWSQGTYEHKAILADAGKNLIGFPISQGYAVYSYENGEFVEKAVIESDTWWYEVRGLFIENYYYIVDTAMGSLRVLDMENFTLCKYAD